MAKGKLQGVLDHIRRIAADQKCALLGDRQRGVHGNRSSADARPHSGDGDDARRGDIGTGFEPSSQDNVSQIGCLVVHGRRIR